MRLFACASLFACGGQVSGDESGAAGSGGQANAITYSCTVDEVADGYSWCALASWDGDCPGIKGTTCAPNFLARCSLAGVVVHYYNVDIPLTKAVCENAGGAFSAP